MYKYVNAVTGIVTAISTTQSDEVISMTLVEVLGQAPSGSLYAGRATGSRDWNGNLDHTGFPARCALMVRPEVNSRQIPGLAWAVIRTVYNLIRNCKL